MMHHRSCDAHYRSIHSLNNAVVLRRSRRCRRRSDSTLAKESEELIRDEFASMIRMEFHHSDSLLGRCGTTPIHDALRRVRFLLDAPPEYHPSELVDDQEEILGTIHRR